MNQRVKCQGMEYRKKYNHSKRLKNSITVVKKKNCSHTQIRFNYGNVKISYFAQCCGSGSTCFWTSRIRIHWSEVWIRILLSSCKNSKKKLDSYYFVTLFDFLSLKNDVYVASKSNKQKRFCEKISFLLAS
jgi:hypothetical protein